MRFRKKQKTNRSKILKKRWPLKYLPIELFDSLKRQQLISPGFFLTVLLIFFPIGLWLNHNPSSINDPIIALAKFNAFMAISTLSVNFILSARFKFLERLFYGLDRMIRVHKVVGRSTFIFVLLHPLFLIISAYPNIDIIMNFVLPIGEIQLAVGVIAVYLFLLLITLTVAINMPYHFWHNSHKLLGIVLIAAGYHALIIGSDINNFPYLQIFIAALVGIGLLCWLYMLIFYKKFGPKYQVTIEKVVHFKNITELYLSRPAKFNYRPGQYVFIRFPRFEGFVELFPFTISTDPSKTHLRLSIKQSGDYTTENIPRLRKNDKAIIMGPYGRFGHQYLQHKKDMVWIAGGIGITPFLSLAKHESLFPTGRKIHLIWVIRNKKEAFHDAEFIDEALKNENFSYVHWFSEKQGRITSKDITDIIGGKQELKERLLFMCGPPNMMYSLCKGFNRYHIPYRHIIFEDFNMLD